MIKLQMFRMRKIWPLFLLSLIIFFHLFLLYKTFVVDSAGNIRTASAGYGDIPFHMTQVSKFAFGQPLDFNEPIFDGERLRYPFFVNLLSGLLLRFDADWFFAMQAVAMTCVAGGIFLTFLFYKSILKSSFASVVAIVIFLLGSGFGSLHVISQSNASSVGEFVQYTVEATTSTITRWDAVYPEQNIGWGAPLSLVFLHQRSFLLGFFMFSLFLFVFQKWRNNQSNFKLTILLGLVVGLTPLSHYHSFVAMSVVLVLFAIFTFFQKGRGVFSNFFVLGLSAAIFALPQIFYLVQGKNGILSSDNSFIQFRLGWMSAPTIGSVAYKAGGSFFENVLAYFNFIFVNFGVVLPVFLLATFFFLKSFGKRARSDLVFWSICGLFLFLLVQIIRFQPWDYDNNKILVYFQYFAAVVIVAFFGEISKYRKRLGYFLLAAFVALAIHSGIIDQIPRLLTPVDNLPVIFNKDSVAIADYIRNANMPQNEKILTTSSHLNLVNSLAGRPAVVGYPGWLWTRGIDYSEREKNLKQFFKDPQIYNNIPYLYNARYALLDPSAVYDWDASLAVFDAQFVLLIRHGDFSLYKLY